ncbi:hypothetical protein ACIBG5_41840 [Kribbella sp. NPDC050241]|uniref:hypothetical protein n=1 Tax=Kribbella sp. NPDC050241 TaxID=3364115 RepID=UPI0037946FAF
MIIQVRGADGQPVSVFRPSPLTGLQSKAHEELIAEETRAAERTIADSPGEPGFVHGALATLMWAWRRSGVPPIDVERAQAG